MESPHTNLFLALACFCDVVGGLHAHESVHSYAKGLFDAERHVAGKVGLAIEQAGERGPGHSEDRCGGGHGKAGWFKDFRPNKITGTGRFFMGMAFFLC
jgi:hypothetical protein